MNTAFISYPLVNGMSFANAKKVNTASTASAIPPARSGLMPRSLIASPPAWACPR